MSPGVECPPRQHPQRAVGTFSTSSLDAEDIMPRNIEIKARAPSLAALATQVQALATSGQLLQGAYVDLLARNGV